MKLYSYKRNRTTWLIPIIFVLSGLNSGLIFAQENSIKDIFNYEVRIGANIDLYRGLLSNRDFIKNQFKGQTGIKVFVSGMLNVNSPNWILAYGPTISIYNKSLGNSQDPLENDIQIDFLNSFTAGVGLKHTDHMKYLRTLGNSPAYDLRHDFNYALSLSGNFLINNHHRNQSIGSINVTLFDALTLNYCNDGGPGIEHIGSGDNFDRWWTGSGGIYVHSKKTNRANLGFNYFEFTFDQFTGYSPLVYELSNILGANIPEYSLSKSPTTKQTLPSSYNSSAYTMRFSWAELYPVSLEFGVIGSLVERTKKSRRIFGFQDLIHASGGYILHPNRDDTRLFFGATYNTSIYVKD